MNKINLNNSDNSSNLEDLMVVSQDSFLELEKKKTIPYALYPLDNEYDFWAEINLRTTFC